MRLACVSVDLDEIPCYTAIHGLGALDGEPAHAIYRRALPRLERFFEQHAVPATFFVIGRDTAAEGNAAALTRLREHGHELASHSESHHYDLTRRGLDEMRREVLDAQASIERATGERPRGFRAPGYTVTDALLGVLREAGVAWDSSVFPCPAYWTAKAGALGLIRARGRQSRSILDDPRVLTAPADPYRVGTPYWKRGDGLLELPIGVTRDVTGRLPFIGTSVVLAGPRGAAALARLASGRPLVNLELHGIDLADARLDGLERLAPHQPDLRVSAEKKSAALSAAVERLRQDGYRFVTLSEAARELAAAA